MNKSHVQQSKLTVRENDHFGELRKLLEDSPGLALEVEIDEALEDLLGSEERLDVTIIEQSDSPKEATVSLSVNEVTDFIEMVKKGKSQGFDCTTGKDVASDGSPTTVYTTPYTFNNIKQKLPCLNESNEDKPGTPCLCQHCGMVGVLVESQKRPAIPHPPNPKFIPPKHNDKKKEKPTARTRSKSDTNIALLKELNEKIAHLEDRLNEHEEKTVRKDYFKFVIHKLLNQYSNKINELKNFKPSVNISTQYSKTTSRPYSRDRHQEPERDHTDHKRKYKHERFREARDGKESDKPRFRKEQHNDVLKLPPNMDEIEYNRNVYLMNAEYSPFKMKTKRNAVDAVSSETIKKLCDLVYNRYNEKEGVEKRFGGPKRYGEIPEKLLNRRPDVKMGGRVKDDKDKVDVAYVNPAAAGRNWCEGSSDDDFLRRAQGGRKVNKHTIQEKIKYLKMLARKKNVDESELWNNILNQAKKHIKSNEDTVSIQLPTNGKCEEMSELELTLSNLKEIAKRSRVVKKNKSCASIELNFKTSSDHCLDKKHNRRR